MHTPRCLQYRLNHSRLYYTTLDSFSVIVLSPILLVLCGRDQSAAHFRLEFSSRKLPKSLAFRLKIL